MLLEDFLHDMDRLSYLNNMLGRLLSGESEMEMEDRMERTKKDIGKIRSNDIRIDIVQKEQDAE